MRSPAAARRPLSLPVIVAAVVVVLILAWGVNKVLHHKNHYELVANAVTKAIANNDMRPVEKDFNALRRPELEDRGRVGRLSDLVNAQGTFETSKETTPKDARPGYHQFTEQFSRGNLFEKYELDADGKIARFHIGPVPSTGSTASSP